MISDLRFALRAWRNRPAAAALAIAMLAIGIGANAAIFSVVYSVLLRPLPYPRSDRIVRLWEHTSRSARVNVSGPNLRDWQARLTSFAALAGYEQETTTVLGGLEPTFADVYAVTGDFFNVFQVPPALGRTFAPDERTTGGPFAVVISDRFWKRSLGGQPQSRGASPLLAGPDRARGGRHAAAVRFSRGRRHLGGSRALDGRQREDRAQLPRCRAAADAA